MRAWVRIDEGIDEHPRVAGLEPAAAWTFIRSILYASRRLTDGFIPGAIALRIAGDVNPSTLVDAGLWIEVEGGYKIRDYLDYQQSRSEVLGLKQIREEAGRKGVIASGKARSQAKSKRLLRESFAVASSKVEPELEPEQEKNKPITPLRRSRAADPLWDALVSVMGASPAGMERGRWNAARKSLAESGATAEKIRQAAHAYRTMPTFANCALTPTALASNWTVLTANGNGHGEPLINGESKEELAARISALDRQWYPNGKETAP